MLLLLQNKPTKVKAGINLSMKSGEATVKFEELISQL